MRAQRLLPPLPRCSEQADGVTSCTAYAWRGQMYDVIPGPLGFWAVNGSILCPLCLGQCEE